MFLLIVDPSLASAPEQSLRPSERVLSASTSQIVNHHDLTEINAPKVSTRPTRRAIDVLVESIMKEKLVNNPKISKRPKRKKPSIRIKSLFSKRSVKGSVCGINGVIGTRIGPIVGKLKGCGVSNPVRITEVDGVALTQAAIMDCDTAKSLYSWVKKSVKPAVKRKGGGVRSLKVAAHYSCRTRNNKRGARISEHGKGKAIDISAINLNDGTTLTVLKDWRSRNRRIMRNIHKGACGPFGTVLGPKSDRFHQNHFHLDTARYRTGPYCR